VHAGARLDAAASLQTFAEDLALAQARALHAGVEITIWLRPVAERDRALRVRFGVGAGTN
jgi:hypothetical protein